MHLRSLQELDLWVRTGRSVWSVVVFPCWVQLQTSPFESPIVLFSEYPKSKVSSAADRLLICPCPSSFIVSQIHNNLRQEANKILLSCSSHKVGAADQKPCGGSMGASTLPFPQLHSSFFAGLAQTLKSNPDAPCRTLREPQLPADF